MRLRGRYWPFTDNHAQFFARRSARQRSGDYGLPFLEDVRPGSVVELVGSEGTGKTQVLMHMIVTTVLPKRFGGMEAGAVIVDADMRFPFYRLATVLEARIRAQPPAPVAAAAAATSLPRGGLVSDEEVRLALLDSLDRVIMMQTRTSTELLAALHSIWGILDVDPLVSLLCIDSISAFYWQDRSAAGDLPNEATLTQRGVIKALGKLQADFPLVVAVTKPVFFTHREGFKADQQHQQHQQREMMNLPPELVFRDHMCKEWFQFVTHKLILGEGGAVPGVGAGAAGGAAAKAPRPLTAGLIYRKSSPHPVQFFIGDRGVTFPANSSSGGGARR